MGTVEIGPEPLEPAQVVQIARGGGVRLADAARPALARGRAVVEQLRDSETPVYGISTGFGALATRHIPPDQRTQLQRSLIRSHAAGMGPPVETEVVRAMMALRLRTLATGLTGVRVSLAETLAALLDAGITPVVPEHGSLGCSGDLAPLAHVALVLMGEGIATGPDGTTGDAAPMLAAHGITAQVLEEKEGLALINGTDGMLGMLVLAAHDLAALLTAVDLTAAMSVEALLGTDRVYAADLQALRPHPGQAASAANLRALLAGSGIVASHREGDVRVQDAYSMRCAPQVAGAARDVLDYARTVAGRELASVIDNPVVMPDGRVASNGNFHGAPLAHVCDYLAIAIADVASMAERRTDRLLDVNRSHGLPPFLAHDPGVDSGLMIAHYTQAAVVADLKRNAVPASVDSIPTSAMQEDHVSMGWAAARKLRRSVAGLRQVLAIELTAAARGLDLRAADSRGPALTPAPGTAAALSALRERVGRADGPDRWLAPELTAAEDALLDVVAAAAGAAGPLA